jgi:carbonic anhydrase
VSRNNVSIIVNKIKEQSIVLSEMEHTGQIKITGGLYDIDTGRVAFFD